MISESTEIIQRSTIAGPKGQLISKPNFLSSFEPKNGSNQKIEDDWLH